jgi:hypothetical protein
MQFLVFLSFALALVLISPADSMSVRKTVPRPLSILCDSLDSRIANYSLDGLDRQLKSLPVCHKNYSMWMWQSPAEKYLDRIEKIEAAVSQKVQEIRLIQQDELIALRKRLQVLEFENKEMKKKLESQEANVVVIDSDREKEQLRTELRKVTREKQAMEQTLENLRTRIARFFVPRSKALQNQITDLWTELRDAQSDKQDLERTIADQKKSKLRMKFLIVPFLVVFILEHLVI